MEALKTFDHYGDYIDKLVAKHQKMQEEPLLLAIHYQPDGEAKGPCLLEVADQFGSNRVNEFREIMQVRYLPSVELPLREGEVLSLILTNPPEFEEALKENWPGMREFRQAVDKGKWRIAYMSQDEQAERLVKLLQ